MTHSAAALAAIASAAVPGLDPVSVQELVNRRHEWFQVALVTDTRSRRWVVRVPLTPAAGAELDQTQSLTALLDRRLPYALPVAQGHLRMGDAGRASVSTFIPGHPLQLAGLPPTGTPAAQVGRAIAALHNLDARLYDEVAAPSYDTESYRQRREADLERAARTGRVPTGLLSRWEYALEESRLWRFATCPVHGGLMGRNILATFEGESAEEGRVTGVTGWETSRVADPADDFAWLIGQCGPETWKAVRDAYAQARAGGADEYLDSRARLAAELHLMSSLLAAVTADDEELVDSFAEKLRYLDYDTSQDDIPLVPPRGRLLDAITPTPALADDDEVTTEPTAEPHEGGDAAEAPDDRGTVPDQARERPSADDDEPERPRRRGEPTEEIPVGGATASDEAAFAVSPDPAGDGFVPVAEHAAHEAERADGAAGASGPAPQTSVAAHLYDIPAQDDEAPQR